MSFGKKLAGFWLTLASPTATEIAAEAGFDWLLIDMEHAPNDLNDVIAHLRAAGRRSAEPVVRVPWLNAGLVERLMDAGVRSFMFPSISSADEAIQAVASTRYPPNGVRGVSGITRGGWYGRSPSYFRNSEQQTCVILQLESVAALGQAENIGGIDGVDGLFIGPNDLAADMGYLGNAGATEVQEAIQAGLGAIKKTGKAAGILDFDTASADRRFTAGFNFIAVGGDASALVRRTDELVRHFAPSAAGLQTG